MCGSHVEVATAVRFSDARNVASNKGAEKKGEQPRNIEFRGAARSLLLRLCLFSLFVCWLLVNFVTLYIFFYVAKGRRMRGKICHSC